MNIDFPLLLLLLVLGSGLILLYDRLRRAPGRRRAFEQLRQELPQWQDGDSIQHLHYLDRSERLRAPRLVEYASSFFPVLLIVFVLRSFLFEPFQIPSSSMLPTLRVGDFILVNKYTYGIRLPVFRTKVWDMNQPRRGDVMVFFPPHLNDTYFIKRVIGLPGDKVSYVNKRLLVNGEPVPQQVVEAPQRAGQSPRRAGESPQRVGEAPRRVREPARRFSVLTEQLDSATYQTQVDTGRGSGDFSVTVKPGHYFMMGDNRDNSSDSRVWGQVAERDIVGRAFAVWMHWDSFFSLPSFQRVGGID